LEDLAGPARPGGISDVSIAGDRSESNSDDTENGAGDSDEDDMEEDPYRLPISHEVNLEGEIWQLLWVVTIWQFGGSLPNALG
jgi:hypothetical protein